VRGGSLLKNSMTARLSDSFCQSAASARRSSDVIPGQLGLVELKAA